uniref:Uncharacterized protein n=1 Tax=Octopus bimaculoides TaxID=37653 RepID=A0A0L8FPD5_OCTBM
MEHLIINMATKGLNYLYYNFPILNTNSVFLFYCSINRNFLAFYTKCVSVYFTIKSTQVTTTLTSTKM